MGVLKSQGLEASLQSWSSVGPRKVDPSKIATMHTLDHLMWEELTLEAGETRFAEATGIKPTFGGKHSHSGTHNSLLSLGYEVYLEIISLDPEHPRTAETLRSAPPDFAPKLIAFGVKATDLDYVERLVAKSGLEVAQRHDITRQSFSGEVWRWETLVVGGHTFENCLPFFTQSSNALHTSETSPKGCELLEFLVCHPEYKTLLRLYEEMEIGVPVIQAEHPHLRAILQTPKGLVELSSKDGLRRLSS